MQFQELIQSSLTKHVNTALKYFLCSERFVITPPIRLCGCLESFLNFLMLFTGLFRKLSKLSDAIYGIKFASLDAKVSQVFCHNLTKKFALSKFCSE